MRYVSEWSFTKENGVTTVLIKFSGQPTTFPAKVLNLIFALMAGSMKKAFLADMADMKKYLEQGGR